MKLRVTPAVEEFFNHHHARTTGRFASGTGGGLFSIAKTSKKTPKLFKTHSEGSAFKSRSHRIFMPKNRKGMIFGTATEEFYNSHHSPQDGKFTSGGSGVNPKQKDMQRRSANQDRMALVNRARANQGLKPLDQYGNPIS